MKPAGLITNIACILLVAQIVFAVPSSAAELAIVESRSGPIVTLDGPIETGDADQFRSVMRKVILQPGIDRLVVALDSPGGNVGEAIKIGKIVRAVLAETWTTPTLVWSRDVEGRSVRLPGHKERFANPDEPLPALSRCWSACTIIFYSGVERQVFDNRDHRIPELEEAKLYPTIGVHRPRYPAETYSQLSPETAQIAYAQMLQDMSEALAEMGAPDEFIKRTMATPSEDVDLISMEDMRRLVTRVEPFFEDWLTAKCGHMRDILANQEERDLYRRYDQMWEEFEDMPALERMDWDHDVALVAEFGLNDAIRVNNLAEKVSQRSKYVDFCEETTVRTVRHDWATEID